LIGTLNVEWPDLPVAPQLCTGDVHLIAATMPENFSAVEHDWSFLSEAEARRARRFKFDRHRNRWFFGRQLLKQLLARYLACDIDSIQLGFGEIGKPFVAKPAASGLCFNYTDSSGHLIFAMARDVEVGVDLEFLPRKTAYAALSARKFSDIEQAALAALPEAERENAFLAGWTRKESYGKALGVGIRFPMAEVTLCDDFKNPGYTVVTKSGQSVQLSQITPPFSGIACLATMTKSFNMFTYSLSNYST
jgi:4'-phosphopantetheinyl transferase